jgi:ATP-dependent DNA helicase RecQ
MTDNKNKLSGAAALDALLTRHFGFKEFHPGQREPIEAVLGGEDAVVVMPTGSGKSLCYQLAAMAMFRL